MILVILIKPFGLIRFEKTTKVSARGGIIYNLDKGICAELYAQL